MNNKPIKTRIMKSEFIVKEKPKPIIDWDKPQMLISNNRVVFSTGRHQENGFEGVCINAKDGHKFPEFSIGWDKGSFIPLAPGDQVILTA